MKTKPLVRYNINAQKRSGYFAQILTSDVLEDICFKATGCREFEVETESESYNKGRLVTIEYNNVLYYVTLSEDKVEGRNSSVQSVPSALNLFYADDRTKKKLCYYFIPYTGNYFTEYHKFIFRLLKTVGVQFLNLPSNCSAIYPYSNINEIMSARRETQGQNKSNNSSYITKFNNRIQIFGKTFGASKYESTLMALAAAKITKGKVDFFNVAENGLVELPKSSQITLSKFANIEQHSATQTLDKKISESLPETASLRNGSYLYNLLSKLGEKKCCMCQCGIPEIIQGAHIWEVSAISKTSMDFKEKFQHVNNSDNGLWLCQNHHKLFDSNIIMLLKNGQLCVRLDVNHDDEEYIKSITSCKRLDVSLLTERTKDYISKRNSNLCKEDYHSIDD